MQLPERCFDRKEFLELRHKKAKRESILPLPPNATSLRQSGMCFSILGGANLPGAARAKQSGEDTWPPRSMPRPPVLAASFPEDPAAPDSAPRKKSASPAPPSRPAARKAPFPARKAATGYPATTDNGAAPALSRTTRYLSPGSARRERPLEERPCSPTIAKAENENVNRTKAEAVGRPSRSPSSAVHCRCVEAESRKR